MREADLLLRAQLGIGFENYCGLFEGWIRRVGKVRDELVGTDVGEPYRSNLHCRSEVSSA